MFGETLVNYLEHDWITRSIFQEFVTYLQVLIIGQKISEVVLEQGRQKGVQKPSSGSRSEDKQVKVFWGENYGMKVSHEVFGLQLNLILKEGFLLLFLIKDHLQITGFALVKEDFVKVLIGTKVGKLGLNTKVVTIKMGYVIKL